MIILTSYSPPFFACHAQVWLTMSCLCQHACLPSVANSLGPLELVFLSFFYLVISQDTSRKRHSNWITGRVFNNLLSTVWSESRGTTRNDTGIVPRVSLPLLAYKGKEREILLETKGRRNLPQRKQPAHGKFAGKELENTFDLILIFRFPTGAPHSETQPKGTSKGVHWFSPNRAASSNWWRGENKNGSNYSWFWLSKATPLSSVGLDISMQEKDVSVGLKCCNTLLLIFANTGFRTIYKQVSIFIFLG